VGQHGGGTALGEQINSAFRKALDLEPNAGTYLEYIQWLRRSSGSSLFTIGVCPEELCATVNKALQAYPGNPELIAIDEEIKNLQAQNAPYATQYALNLTATADALGSQATQQAMSSTATAGAIKPTAVSPSASPVPSRTPAATATVPAVSEKSPPGLSPVVWVSVIGLAVLLLLFGLRQRPRYK